MRVCSGCALYSSPLAPPSSHSSRLHCTEGRSGSLCAMLAPRHHRGGKMMRAGDDIGHDLRCHRIGNGWFQNTNHGRGTRAAEALQPYCLSNHAGIGMQRRPPEVIGQHHSSGGILTVIGRSQQASKHRAQAHHLEVVSIHHARWKSRVACRDPQS